MKRRLLFWCLSCLALVAMGQSNNNGEIDQITELTTTYEIAIPMPDGVNLMTNITVPVTSDSMVVPIDLGFGPVDLEFIPKGLPLISYDMLNGSPNPNPQQLPLILTRTPYDKSLDPTGSIIALLGYAYAAQDMRGRYASEGVYLPMYSDAWEKTSYHAQQHILDVTNPSDPATGNKHEDGYNTIDYLANQLNTVFDYDNDNNPDALFNGSIGMFGPSALGNAQYQAAATRKIDPSTAGLQSLLPIVATNEHYNTTGYKNGVFRQSLVSGWLEGQLQDMEDVVGTDNNLQNAQHTPFDYGETNENTVIELGIDHFSVLDYGTGFTGAYPNSAGRADMDASFAAVDAAGIGSGSGTNSRYSNMEVPAYHLTGWWDIFVDGQIQTWQNMRDHTNPSGNATDLQKLVIGPWAHQTIGSTTTGDMTYNANVTEAIGADITNIDPNNADIAELLDAEMLTWLRYTLNQNSYKNIGEPKYLIPASDNYQPVQVPLGPFMVTQYVRVPSQDFSFTLDELINYAAGYSGLGTVSYSVHPAPNNSSTTYSDTYDIPPPTTPLITTSGPVGPIAVPDFKNNVPNFRGYVVGPVGDGIAANANVGNYWIEADAFPLTSGIAWTDMFLHQNGDLDEIIPTTDEGSLMYAHDPNNPASTLGGANMIPDTPDGSRTSQGQINLADPALRPYGLDHPGVIAFESAVIQDSLSIVGFPEAHLFACSNPQGVAAGQATSTDFMVTILDVYPDGRELFVVEGAVNARARDYAKSLVDDNENINAAFTNINAGDVYEYNFRMLPIAYTFGKDHRIKVLISSASYPRYQSNPNLPLETGEFFRWKPGSSTTYNFQGTNMSPRIVDNTIHFSDIYPSSIKLPVVAKQVFAEVKVFLKGAASGASMNTTLNPIVPLTHPYNVPPHNYTGSESITAVPANVVDWVLLELRDSTNPAMIIARKAALLRSDGTVVDVNGSTTIAFDHVDAGQYYIAVRHRNHLGVMSDTPLNFN